MSEQSEDPGVELEELQGRIERLKEKEKPPDPTIASMHLAFSLGVTVIGGLLMGDFFGRILADKAGNPQFRLVGWALGAGLAAYSGYRLIKPYLV